MFEKLTYKLTELWLKRISKVKVTGPLLFGSNDYLRMMEFRSAQNQLRAPYLEEKHQAEIEARLKIDERSLHFILEKDGEIAVCVRLTPLPFEFSALSPDFEKKVQGFDNYLEFGRLCTAHHLERKGFYAGILVVKAAHYVFSNHLAKGFVGICKSNLVPYMKKLGLQVDATSIRLPERKNDYHLLHATRDELVRFYFKKVFGIFALKSKPALRLELKNDTRTA